MLALRMTASTRSLHQSGLIFRMHPPHLCAFRSLKSLSLEGCSHVSDTGVAELAQMSTGLTYLNISRCERVGEYGDRALIQLGRSCHQLKGLDAFGCSHAQVGTLHFFLQRRCTRLYMSSHCVR